MKTGVAVLVTVLVFSTIQATTVSLDCGCNEPVASQSKLDIAKMPVKLFKSLKDKLKNKLSDALKTSEKQDEKFYGLDDTNKDSEIKEAEVSFEINNPHGSYYEKDSMVEFPNGYHLSNEKTVESEVEYQNGGFDYYDPYENFNGQFGGNNFYKETNGEGDADDDPVTFHEDNEYYYIPNLDDSFYGGSNTDESNKEFTDYEKYPNEYTEYTKTPERDSDLDKAPTNGNSFPQEEYYIETQPISPVVPSASSFLSESTIAPTEAVGKGDQGKEPNYGNGYFQEEHYLEFQPVVPPSSPFLSESTIAPTKPFGKGDLGKVPINGNGFPQEEYYVEMQPVSPVAPSSSPFSSDSTIAPTNPVGQGNQGKEPIYGNGYFQEEHLEEFQPDLPVVSPSSTSLSELTIAPNKPVEMATCTCPEKESEQKTGSQKETSNGKPPLSPSIPPARYPQMGIHPLPPPAFLGPYHPSLPLTVPRPFPQYGQFQKFPVPAPPRISSTINTFPGVGTYNPYVAPAFPPFRRY